MKIRIVAASLLAASLIGQSLTARFAIAGPAGDAAARAENLLARGETLPAYSAFNTAQHAFWQASPLVFRKAILVDRAGGFGDYDIRADAEFSAGDTLTVYAEPVGFGIDRQSGRFAIAFNTDFAIESDSGQVLARSDDLFSINHRSRSQNRDFNMILSLVVPNLKPGSYVGVFTVKDRISGKTGEFRVPFNVDS